MRVKLIGSGNFEGFSFLIYGNVIKNSLRTWDRTELSNQTAHLSAVSDVWGTYLVAFSAWLDGSRGHGLSFSFSTSAGHQPRWRVSEAASSHQPVSGVKLVTENICYSRHSSVCLLHS